MASNDSLQHVLTGFRENRQAVEELMAFDDAVMAIVVHQLEVMGDRTKKAWTKAFGEEDIKLNPYLEVEKTIRIVSGIRQHESLKPRYETMINQALVLLVSYFGSAVRDVFRAAVRQSVRTGVNRRLLKAAVKTTVAEIREVEDPAEFVAQWLAQSPDLSFQDMKSIGRALGNYFGIDVPRTQRENEIILGQACRHAIVHAGGQVDDQLVRQVSAATPRSVKPKLRAGETIQFREEEVRRVAQAMESYLKDVAEALEAALKLEADSGG